MIRDDEFVNKWKEYSEGGFWRYIYKTIFWPIMVLIFCSIGLAIYNAPLNKDKIDYLILTVISVSLAFFLTKSYIWFSSEKRYKKFLNNKQ